MNITYAKLPNGYRVLYSDKTILSNATAFSRMRDLPVGIFDFDKTEWYLEPTDRLPVLAKAISELTGASYEQIVKNMESERAFDIKFGHIFEAVPLKD